MTAPFAVTPRRTSNTARTRAVFLPLPETGSADRESLVSAPRRVPDLSDSVNAAGCVVRAQPIQQTVAILTPPFSHNLHSAVVEIEGESVEATDLQSVCPGEPAEPYLLYSAAYPSGEPYIFVHARTLTGQLLSEHFSPKRDGVQSRRNSFTRSGESGCADNGVQIVRRAQQMGRHRRSAAAPAAEQTAEGTAGRNQGARRRKRGGLPVRTGLIGVSAAMAVGAVAVASGLLPGGDTYNVGGGPAADHVRSEGAPDLLTQGGSTTAPAGRGSASTPASRGTERPEAPTKSASSKAGTPSASPSRTSEQTPTKTKEAAATATEQARRSASKTPTAETTKSSAPASASSPAKPTVKPTAKASASAPAARKTTAPAAATSAQAAVLALVNQERSKVGCSPVTASSSLASLAQSFSDDMAARGFFDHTDPDGQSPWDRAAKAGVSGLGGENIARGQADAEAVMEAWMNSEGHRANILNCDYKTLGVGIHFGSGGPWWTQDFGF